ncbi:MAG TPA: hypothetical protein VMT66_06100 [Steroidobacteraceae bacterium]|nr:hypothetical protein [Steroidobacteraceae bacterium]
MHVANSSAIANSPFLVGVSGHRDLDAEQLPQLREAVSGFVRQLKEHLPDTDLRLIIGMAAGADLLVAQTAVALGVEVEAVLPMPLTCHASDFDAEALAQLQTLLRHPRVRCMELSPPPGIAAAAEPHSAQQRDALYANLTSTLIRRSSLLLALWDGRVSQLPGGTADTVLRFLGVRNDEHPGPTTVEFLEAPAEAEAAERLVYWAPTARTGTGTCEPRSPCFLQAAGEQTLQMRVGMPELLRRQLAELNHYNAEFRELTAAGRLARPHSLLGVLPVRFAVAERRLLADIDEQYGKADTLAVYFQRRSDRLFDLFAVMAFTMGLAYLVYEKLTESRVLLIAYLLIFLTSLCVYYVLQGRRWFGKHLTYRALAETLRARFYLRLAGADHAVDAAELLALSGIDRFRGFGWIAFVLKGIEPPETRVDRVRESEAADESGVEQAWIDSQHAYFTRKVASLERSSRRVRALRRALFVAILSVISVLFAFGDSLHRIDIGLGVPLRNMLMFSMGTLAVLLGVWELHQDKMATRELLWQYRNQLRHFEHARSQLARISSPRRRRAVLAALGKDSLMESYLWAIHRYHREHEPPAAGGS